MVFLPYLPQDNAGLEDTAGEAAIEAIGTELGRLLRAPAHEFWAAVRGDASLATCLDSYLQYSRWGSCGKGIIWQKLVEPQAHGWFVCNYCQSCHSNTDKRKERGSRTRARLR